MGDSKIRWTDEEKAKLVEIATSVMESHPGITHLEAIRRANEQLPTSRKRDIKSLAMVKWIVPLVKARVTEKKEEVRVETKIVKEVIVQQIKLHEVSLDQLFTELIARLATNSYFQQWVGKTINQFTQVFKQELPSIVRQLKQARKTVGEEKPDDMKKVFIVGLLPEQENEIRDKFDGIFKLAFFKNGEPSRLRQLAQHADRAILMTKFIDHPTQDTVKAACSGVTMCNGAVSDLTAILEQYFKEVV